MAFSRLVLCGWQRPLYESPHSAAISEFQIGTFARIQRLFPTGWKPISTADQTLRLQAQFLNPFFTLTRKSRVPGQTTRVEFDCLSIGTRGKGLRRRWGAEVGTGQKA